MSWGWRKILQLREVVKPFFWVQIGDGMNTSLWYDLWCSQCPLTRFLTPRDMSREGFSIQSRVADLVVNGTWNWPHSWLIKAPILATVPAPTIDTSRRDRMQWRDSYGNMKDFLVKCAWEELCQHGNVVPWFHTVWFSHAIPRHAFQLWLVMRRDLKTQDKLRT
ncbi:putative reverse transcriptase domain-containing protein [Tanacetum coccineum]